MPHELSGVSQFKHITLFTVQMRNKSCVDVQGKGDVKNMNNASGSNVKCVLQEVLYVTGLQYSPMSVGTRFCNGTQSSSDRFGVDVSPNGKTIAHGKAFGKLYILTTFSPIRAGHIGCITDLSTWNERLCHFYHVGVVGMSCQDVVKDDLCHLCANEKLTETEITEGSPVYDPNIHKVVHSVVYGPMDGVS